MKNPVSQGGLAQGHVMAETGKYHWDEAISILWSTGSFHYVTLNSHSSDRVDVSSELVLKDMKWRHIHSPIKCEAAAKSAIKVNYKTAIFWDVKSSNPIELYHFATTITLDGYAPSIIQSRNISRVITSDAHINWMRDSKLSIYYPEFRINARTIFT